MALWILLIALLLRAADAALDVDEMTYLKSLDKKNFSQKLDHFSFASNVTFEQVYLMDQSHWRPGGPIFYRIMPEDDEIVPPYVSPMLKA